MGSGESSSLSNAHNCTTSHLQLDLESIVAKLTDFFTAQHSSKGVEFKSHCLGGINFFLSPFPPRPFIFLSRSSCGADFLFFSLSQHVRVGMTTRRQCDQMEFVSSTPRRRSKSTIYVESGHTVRKNGKTGNPPSPSRRSN